MGYCLLYESMLYSVINARNKFLKDDGLIFPDIASMYITAIDDDKFYKKLKFWDNVYGFKMSVMKQPLFNEGHIENINDNSIISDTVKFIEFSINHVKDEDLKFKRDFKLVVKKTTTITGFLFYFDIFFDQCENKISFSTGPSSPLTHWAQTVFPLENPISVTDQDQIQGTLIFDTQPQRKLLLKLNFQVIGKFSSQNLEYQLF